MIPALARFVDALRAEKVAASPPSGSVILPAVPYIEQKVTPHKLWPSFQTPRGKAISYGAGCCPQSLAIFDRVLTIPIGPRHGKSHVEGIVAAVRRVHGALLA